MSGIGEVLNGYTPTAGLKQPLCFAVCNMFEFTVCISHKVMLPVDALLILQKGERVVLRIYTTCRSACTKY